MIFNIANKTNYTSEPVRFASTQGDSAIIFIAGDFGSGSVKVEVELGDTFYSFPELTFTETTAQRIAIPSGVRIRLKIDNVNLVSAQMYYYSE